MNLKTIVGVIAFISLAPSQAIAGTNFIESHTSADLVGNGPDSVVTTVNYGVQGSNLEATIGAGYASGDDELVIRSEVRYYQYIGNDMTIEGELEALYGTSSDGLSISPELRVRKYL